MPDPLLTLLKYVFLAILYLFFLRVLRAVWIELREPKPAPAVPEGSGVSGVLHDAAGQHQAAGPVRLGPEKLVVLDPDDHKGTEYLVGDEMTVGRAAGCAVSLPDDTFVSQLHARMFRRDGEIFVEDLGSTNGTYVNKKKVTSPAAVHKGDRVQFGRTTMELRK